ncbi:hypothetical protein BIW11_13857 [Tropilaelaps mercedesae]|uniref:Uncharacterized protein n=1 Tax=Tropilaelaps mercedesae TaxID=418985 RepID=A0A1V9X000_9ACAR|nr:hypothetical protein BIW11_13857 [Tropilaelaps mercedesae]
MPFPPLALHVDVASLNPARACMPHRSRLDKWTTCRAYVTWASLWFTEIWSGFDRCTSVTEFQTLNYRPLNITEVRERCPTMSTELISADSEFPARAGHVVQRRTSIPPKYFPDFVSSDTIASPQNISGRAILGRGMSVTTTSSIDSTMGSDNASGYGATAGVTSHETEERSRSRAIRSVAPATPTPHPLLQPPYTINPLVQPHHSPYHPGQRRWSSGDGRSEHGHGGPAHEPYPGLRSSITAMSSAPVAPNPLTYSAGDNWVGSNHPFVFTSPVAKAHCSRSGGPVDSSHWSEGPAALHCQQHVASHQEHRGPALGQQQFESVVQHGRGGIGEPERHLMSADDARLLYQMTLSSRDSIDRSIEPRMLRLLPPEPFHRDSVGIMERPDLADILRLPPELSP